VFRPGQNCATIFWEPKLQIAKPKSRHDFFQNINNNFDSVLNYTLCLKGITTDATNVLETKQDRMVQKIGNPLGDTILLSPRKKLSWTLLVYVVSHHFKCHGHPNYQVQPVYYGHNFLITIKFFWPMSWTDIVYAT